MPKINKAPPADGSTRDDRQNNGAEDGSLRPPRTYVLFADGTGNAFSTQESNVWRLYEALDHTRPDQVACYIKGVGCSAWRPLAALDGATGIGAPSNVRELYRFLCWNWRPGDRIYIFGFSRGAFTARTLVALIASQGLVPAEINGVRVSHDDMQRNTMAAWRAYRQETAPWNECLPTIWLARFARDIVLAVYSFILRFLWGRPSYADVRKMMNGRRDVKIEFLGLFDTVEAFGVPIEEFRAAIDWAIWPISFRNRRVSPLVKRVRHALSLDDERTTFHPIRFDQSDPKDKKRIKEVWFAGVHSDVGGGYPDGALSYVPLLWMAQQVENDLYFLPGAIDRFRACQSAIGPIHDSRSGAAVMYRYGPRSIGDGEADGGPPVVHLSVIERMLHGCDDYAPVTLPASAKVLIPDGASGGEELALVEDKARDAMKSAYAASAKAPDSHTVTAAEAFVRMPPPDEEMVQLALDAVWWRRFAYFSLLGAIALLVAWPWAAETIVAILSRPIDGIALSGVSALDFIRHLDYCLSSVVKSTADFLQSFMPSYVAPWLKIAVYYPVATTALVAFAVFAWRMNGLLRDRIHERARLAWNRPHCMAPNVDQAGWPMNIGRLMRLRAGPLGRFFTGVVIPLVFLGVIFGAALLAAGRSYFNWSAGAGGLCPSAGPVTPVGEQPVTARAPFETNRLCWGSGLWVEKGRRYRIWIAVKEPWFDRTIMSGANGFNHHGMDYVLALPFRRWYRADWFQLVARIGPKGDAELPLNDFSTISADDLPRPRDPAAPKDAETYPVRLEETAEFRDMGGELRRNWREFGYFEPIPQPALAAARDVWRKQGLEDLLATDFIAPESGELFLYVNDVIQFVPFLGPFDLFYGNNSGAAQVSLQRAPQLSPPMEK